MTGSKRTTTASAAVILGSITDNPNSGGYVAVGTVAAALMPPVSASDDPTADDKNYDFAEGKRHIERLWVTYNAERTEINLAPIQRAYDDFEEALRLKTAAEEREQAASLGTANGVSGVPTDHAITSNATATTDEKTENPDQKFSTDQKNKLALESDLFNTATTQERNKSTLGCFSCIPDSFFKPKMLPPKDTWDKDKKALEDANVEYKKSRTRKNLDKVADLLLTLDSNNHNVIPEVAGRVQQINAIRTNLNLPEEYDQFTTQTAQNKRTASSITKFFCGDWYFEAKQLPTVQNGNTQPTARLSLTSMTSN